MSTKRTIKAMHDEETGVGFHLYADWLDELADEDVVHLRIDGVTFEAESYWDRGSITVNLPRDLAERLGLLPPRTEAGGR